MRRINRTLTAKLWIWGSQECRKIGLEYPSSTPEYRVYASPGRSTKKVIAPHYEPDETHLEVSKALENLEELDRVLLRRKYADGLSDKVLQLYTGVSRGTIRWGMEKAYRNIAKELKIPTYA